MHSDEEGQMKSFEEARDSALRASAQNGQLILLNQVLQWANRHNGCFTDGARAELIELAAQYSFKK